MDGRLRNMTGLYLMNQGKMLLLYRIGSKVVSPSWCSVGGHFESGELNDAKACALREAYEEAGVTESDMDNLTFKYVTLRLKNNEIRQNYYFFADLRDPDLQLNTCSEGTLEWAELSEVLQRDMPFTAKGVLQHYLSVGMYDNKIYAGVTTDDQVIFHALNEF